MVAKSSATSFFGLLAINLLAAYLPGLCWIFDLPKGAAPWWQVLLISPAALLTISLSSLGIALCVTAFWICVFTAMGYRFWIAWLVMPTGIAICSLMQGLLVQHIIFGISTLGKC